ncbi:MAG: M23 family metallopeptidase [Candidatus Nealsonbacteria bacterium]|nr:M23 family metallopeptidase [Candidatus Nealsonbacteria bacterium]
MLTSNNKKRFEFAKKTILSFAVCLMSVLLISFFNNLKTNFKSPSNGDFSISGDMPASALESCKITAQALFAEPVKNISCESPQMALIDQNSVVGVASPNLITPQVLGSIIEESSQERDSIVEYVVESTDTLSSIAEKFNISTNTILWANNLSGGSAIKPGQELLILPVSGVLHMAKEGDTLSAIANSYKAKTDDIIAFNNLKDEEDLYIGDVLIIPGGKITPKTPKVELVPTADSYFINPVEGRISQGSHGAFGAAVDISNSCGKPIVAAAGGKVQRTGLVPVGGNIVMILHPNGVVTYYGHLSAITVTPGQVVAQGQIIGYVGNTGYTVGATGCHLHFEVRGTKNFLSRYPRGSSISWK